MAMPVSCVFYPQAALPQPLRAISACLPATHVFEGMRTALLEDRIAWDRLAWACELNLVY